MRWSKRTFAYAFLALLPFMGSKQTKAFNVLPNGSFEIQNVPDVPDCWDHYLGPKKVDGWYDLWLVDRKESYHGKTSMKLITPSEELVGAIRLEPNYRNKYARYRNWQVPKKGRIYTLSVYMKSDKGEYRVNVRTKGDHEFVVGRSWQRFVVTGEVPSRYFRLLSVRPKDIGTLWVDAVQLEEGTEASLFEVSPYDEALHKVMHSSRMEAIKKLVRDHRNREVSELQVFPDRSYYTSEDQAWVSVRLNGNSRQWRNKEIELEMCEASAPDSKVLFREKRLISSDSEIVQIPVRGLPVGRYQILARVMDGGSAMFGSRAILSRLTPAEHEVKIDHTKRNIVVDGDEFFFFAASFARVHEHMGSLRRLLPALRDHGYTAVIASFSRRNNDARASSADIVYFFDRAQQYGLKVVVWVNPNAVKDDHGFTKLKYAKASVILEGYKREIANLASIVQNHEALLAWYLCDEPDDHQLLDSGFTAELVEFARGVDPYHPHFVNYGNLLRDFQVNQGSVPGDIVSRTQYPVPIRPVSDISIWTDLEYLAGQGIKPVTLWLQFAANKGRYPKPTEMTAMVYLAAVHGATGFQTWPIMPGSRILWEHMKTMIREMRELAPVLYAPYSDQTVEVDNKSVRHMTKVLGDELYIVAVNSSDKPTKAVFSLLEGAGENAKVMFEKRAIKIKRNQIKDSFKPFERHVYLISMPGSRNEASHQRAPNP